MDSPSNSIVSLTDDSTSDGLPSPLVSDVRFNRSLSVEPVRTEHPSYSQQMSLPMGLGDQGMIVHGNLIHGNIIQHVTTDGPTSRMRTDWDTISESEPVDSVEEKIRQELQRDPPNHEEIVKALEVLSEISDNFTVPRLDFVNLVLQVMDNHPRQLLIQREAMSCLLRLQDCLSYYSYNTQYAMILKEVINGMERFPFDLPLLQLGLQLMYSLRRCFRSLDFDTWNCAKIVLNSLMFRDKTVQANALMILSSLIDHMPESEQQKIGEDQNYRQSLCTIIEAKYKDNICDQELKIVLNVWSKLSFFLHIRYHIIHESRLNLFIELFNKFSNDLRVKQKLLTILDYTGRVEDSHLFYIKRQFLQNLVNYTKDEDLKVSFLSTSLLANLFRHAKAISWTVENVGLSKEMILDAIKTAVSTWKLPTEPLTKFGTFSALWQVMTNSKYEELQLLAAWTLTHLCLTDDSKYYVRLVEAENMVESINNFLPSCYKKYDLSNTCYDILELMQMEIDEHTFDISTLSRKYKPLIRGILIDLKKYDCEVDNIQEIFQPLCNAFKENKEIVSSTNLVRVIVNIADSNKNDHCILTEILRCLRTMAQNTTESVSSVCPTIFDFCSSRMEEFSKNETIQEACISCLNDVVLHPLDDARKRNCICMMLDILYKFESRIINETCVKVTAIASSSISEDVVQEVGNQPTYKNKLFSLINDLLRWKTYTNIHLDALTVFYHLISFRNIFSFTLHGNVDLFVELLASFANENEVTKRVLPILIKEFSNFPAQPAPKKLSDALATLIQSEEFGISHCAAILTYIYFNGDEDQSTKFVAKWKNRSVKKNDVIPISLCILGNSYFTRHSLFAVWILHQAISREPAKYCKMIKNVGDEEEIQILVDESKNVDEVNLANDIIHHLNSFSFEMEKIDVVEKLLQQNFVEPYAVQRCLHCLRLHAECQNKLGILIIDRLITLLIHYWRYSGIQREGLAFLNAMCMYISTNLDSSKLKTKIIQQIRRNHWRHFSKTVFHYSAKCLSTLNYDSFDQIFTVLNFIVESIYEFASNDELSTCHDILIKMSASSKPGTQFPDWRNTKMYLQSLYKFIDGRFMFTIHNNEMLFRCFLKLICCLNQFNIKFRCDFKQMKLTTKFLKKFGAVSNIEIDAAVAVSSMCQRIEDDVNIESTDFSDSGNRLIAFARRLLKNSNLMIRFCAIAMSIHLTRTQSLRYFMEHSLGGDVIAACMKEVKETVLQLESKQLDVNLNTVFYKPSRLKELLANNQVECRLFAIWVFRHLYLSKDGVADYGLQYKTEILDIIDQLSVKPEKDENVKRMSMNICQMLPRQLNAPEILQVE